MAVLGSQNGTIKATTPFPWKKRSILCLRSDGAVHTCDILQQLLPVSSEALPPAVAGLGWDLYFTGKNKSYLFTQSRASLEPTKRKGKCCLNLNRIALPSSQRPKKTTLNKNKSLNNNKKEFVTILIFFGYMRYITVVLKNSFLKMLLMLHSRR